VPVVYDIIAGSVIVKVNDEMAVNRTVAVPSPTRRPEFIRNRSRQDSSPTKDICRREHRREGELKLWWRAGRKFAARM
jgi:hypothetical protein